jgi:hypothetical protein
MLRELSSVDEVVAVLGQKAVIALTGRSVEYAAQNVSNWRAAGSFPADTFGPIVRALKRKGCSAPLKLWRWGKRL